MKEKLGNKYKKWLIFCLFSVVFFGSFFTMGIQSSSQPILREQVVYLSSLAIASLALGISIAILNFLWDHRKKQRNDKDIPVKPG